MYVKNVAAYENAIELRIRANANTTRRRKWQAMDRHQEASDFLSEKGQFEPTGDNDSLVCHPWVAASYGSFYFAMQNQAREWGGLSEKQHAAVLKMIDGVEQRIADKAAYFEAAAAASEHFGEIGQWYDEELTFIGRQRLYASRYGYVYKTTWKTSCGKTVFHKGATSTGLLEMLINYDDDCDENGDLKMYEKGTKMKVRFKVKSFDKYRDFKSTVISHIKKSNK